LLILRLSDLLIYGLLILGFGDLLIAGGKINLYGESVSIKTTK